MAAPTTLREEIRQLLAGSDGPLTRPEIFAKCKLAADEKTLSVTISQLLAKGDIRRAGERERLGSQPLALYASGTGEPAAGAVSTPHNSVRASHKTAPKSPRSAHRKRSGAKRGRPPNSARKATRGRGTARKIARLPAAAGVPATTGRSTGKVSRNTSAAPAPEGFRCGIFSDGALAIHAAAGELTLTKAEHRAMLEFLDRVLNKGGAE